MYRASGSISANISEGFSRLSGRDQARFYEYGLGSAREARDWYFKSRQVLGPAVTQPRLSLLAQIIRLLLKMIPKYRSQRIKEAGKSYEAEESQNNSDDLSNLLDNIPLPS